MKRKVSMWTVLIVSIIIILITFFGTLFFSLTYVNNTILNIKNKEQIYNKISEIEDVIRQYYVEDVDISELVTSTASGFVSGLKDRYSRYLDKEQMDEYLISTDGVLVGIGITAKQSSTGHIEIIDVYDNSPAKEAELKSGDLIVSVDNEAVDVIGYEKAINKVRGQEGTVVELLIRRDGNEYKKSIHRKKVEIPSIQYRLIDNLGYIKIIEFNQSTTAQFLNALDDLLQKNVTGLIFDVRNNPGGTLDSVVEILDALLPEGDIVSAKYRGDVLKVLATSDSKEISLPMIVLANSNTASAGELFTAALKDYNKAEVVGVNTFGKGVMQSLIPLKDGTGITLTTAYFNPPKSGNFNNIGIPPDYEVILNDEQEKNFSSLNEYTDPQLIKAIELLK